MAIQYMIVFSRGSVITSVEESRSALKMLTGKPTGKTPLRWPRGRWEDNMRMDLK